MPGGQRAEFQRRLAEWVQRERGYQVEWEARGGRAFYQESEAWEAVRVLYDRDWRSDYAERTHKGRFTVQIAGGFFDGATQEQLQTLGRVFEGLDFHPSRVDTYVDDVNKTVALQTVWEACKEGQVRGFREKKKSTGKGGIRRIEELGSNGGEGTIYFGGRGRNGNGKHARWYDKEAESGGEEKGNRFEVEWSGDYAAGVWFALVGFGFQEYDIGARTLSAIEFVENVDAVRSEDWIRADWWDRLCNGIERVRFQLGKRKSSVAKKMEWVGTGVSKSLAVIQRFYVKLTGSAEGFDRWLRGQIEEAGAKIRKAELAMIANELRDYRCRVGVSSEGCRME